MATTLPTSKRVLGVVFPPWLYDFLSRGVTVLVGRISRTEISDLEGIAALSTRLHMLRKEAGREIICVPVGDFPTAPGSLDAPFGARVIVGIAVTSIDGYAEATAAVQSPDGALEAANSLGEGVWGAIEERVELDADIRLYLVVRGPQIQCTLAYGAWHKESEDAEGGWQLRGSIAAEASSSEGPFIAVDTSPEARADLEASAQAAGVAAGEGGFHLIVQRG